MIKVVTFDLDGVYFLKGKENFIANLIKLGVSEEEAKRVFLKSDQMNEQYKRGLISGEEFWQWALGEWDLKMTVKEIIDLMISGYEVNKDAQGLVRKLRREGIKAAICSNNFPERIEGLNKRFDFLKDFDVVVLSYEVGALKPERKIYEELIGRSGVKPEEILYSDDRQDVIKAAKSLGINVFFYEKFEDFEKHLKKFGVAV
jgi:putative hydrolase of the HAD superfamily